MTARERFAPRGHAVIATVMFCTFFACFTGASGVTIAALGGLAAPLLGATGLLQPESLGLVTATGSPGGAADAGNALTSMQCAFITNLLLCLGAFRPHREEAANERR
ncbi:MAG: hypothetical protein EPN19_01995 [Betaproteobacteria bacterium]|nr:MAG: hypothetical protein EPO29_10585 [Betaproteobacteria bacterium]TAN55893.1 MAG: hypothetical protein EPN19_01995 [Betaproteobacteria bacterium]